MEPTYLLVGGDRRQFWLSRLLVPRGRVFTLSVPGLEDQRPTGPVDVLILPTPCMDGAGLLRRSGEGMDTGELRGFYDAHTRIYGGALPADLNKKLPGSGWITDLLADPAVAAANGRLTAEAALALSAEHLEGSLFDLPCLVLGYGRIGKPLAALLAAHHAKLTVTARRPGVRAEAEQLGYETRDFPELSGSWAVVFNTVPEQTLSQSALSALGRDCLWVELASAPGGLPSGCSPAFRVLTANSLPGRRLPRSAASVLLAGIMRREAC